MKKTVWLIATLGILGLNACDLDLLGYFRTPYGVQQRFQESTNIAPPPDTLFASTNFFSFIHITDIHVYQGTNIHLGRLPSVFTTNDRFIVATGDLINTGQELDYQAYLSMMSNMGRPFYSVLGNHDLWNGGWQYYPLYLGSPVYSVQAGNIRLISLDSANATLCLEQRQWLEQQLISRQEPLCVVMMHFNLLSPQIGESGQYADIEEVYALQYLFEKYQVDYVLMGHSHIYDYKKINGVNYLVGDELKENSAEHKNYNRLIVSNGQISHEFLPLD